MLLSPRGWGPFADLAFILGMLGCDKLFFVLVFLKLLSKADEWKGTWGGGGKAYCRGTSIVTF